MMTRSEVVRTVGCPKCKAPAGAPCLTERQTPRQRAHAARWVNLPSEPGRPDTVAVKQAHGCDLPTLADWSEADRATARHHLGKLRETINRDP